MLFYQKLSNIALKIFYEQTKTCTHNQVIFIQKAFQCRKLMVSPIIISTIIKMVNSIVFFARIKASCLFITLGF